MKTAMRKDLVNSSEEILLLQRSRERLAGNQSGVVVPEGGGVF